MATKRIEYEHLKTILSEFKIALQTTEHHLSYTRSLGIALEAHIQTILKEEGESLPKSEELAPPKRQEDSLPFPPTTVADLEFTPLTVPPWHHRVRAQKTMPNLRKAVYTSHNTLPKSGQRRIK